MPYTAIMMISQNVYRTYAVKLGIMGPIQLLLCIMAVSYLPKLYTIIR